MRPGSGDGGERRRGVLRRDRLGQHGAVGDAAGGGQRLGSAHAGEQLRHRGGHRGGIEPHALELLAAEQAAHRGERALEQRQRPLGPGADLAQPARHAVAYAGVEATGEQLLQRGELHGEERVVAHRGGQDADAHPQGRRGGEHGGGLRDAAAEAEVLHHP
ncbi:hypothetical protein GCM10025874_16880 [Arenivirga flava]|uniref:Uncharacterized protein n=1 Tax=Arenivirga flava TaxID=1930060 RepID=A0AA37UFL9_9MICO|nr:hypothetical protein GCM10025874_16880 [Arenivirga flava]